MRLFLLKTLALITMIQFGIVGFNSIYGSDTIRVKQFIKQSDSILNRYPDSAFVYANRALSLTKSPTFLSLIYQCLGKYYIHKEDFGKATRYFLDALKIEEKANNTGRIADLNSDLGYIYCIIEKFEKSQNYTNKALELFTKTKDSTGIAKCYLHLGNLNLSREFCENRTTEQKIGDFKKAQSFYLKSLDINKKLGNLKETAKCYNNLGITYKNLNQPEKALHLLSKSLEYFKQINDWEEITSTENELGKVYRLLKNYPLSIATFQECLRESKKRNITQGIQFVHEALAYTYYLAKDYKNAYYSYITYMTIRDSVYNNQKSKQIFELETKYQTQKKEVEILQLKIAKDKRDLFIYFLLFLVIILIFLYLNFLNKRKLSNQELRLKEQIIQQLEKDRQLLATKSVLQGEETERSRIAKDLHDGLGGLLSGVKLTLANMKGNSLLTDKNVDKFDQALGLLDTSIKELRRVAHNMMPENLVKFGLNEALAEFCQTIQGNSIQVNYQFFGTEARIDTSFEINTYRIAQELINNALKHSDSRDLLVQLIQDEKRIHLIVQDNGKGFDKEKIKKNNSAGLANIKSRVESLKGTYDILSEPGKGTEVSVEFIW